MLPSACKYGEGIHNIYITGAHFRQFLNNIVKLQNSVVMSFSYFARVRSILQHCLKKNGAVLRTLQHCFW